MPWSPQPDLPSARRPTWPDASLGMPVRPSGHGRTSCWPGMSAQLGSRLGVLLPCPLGGLAAERAGGARYEWLPRLADRLRCVALLSLVQVGSARSAAGGPVGLSPGAGRAERPCARPAKFRSQARRGCWTCCSGGFGLAAERMPHSRAGQPSLARVYRFFPMSSLDSPPRLRGDGSDGSVSGRLGAIGGRGGAARACRWPMNGGRDMCGVSGLASVFTQ